MEQPLKPNGIKKLWFKLTDKQKYYAYKRLYAHHRIQASLSKFLQQGKVLTVDKIKAIADDEINCMHSGNSGDIMYALPVLKEIARLTMKPVNLLLKLNEPLNIDPMYAHPLGNVMLNEKMANALIPLIEAQSYIGKCAVLQGDEKIHVDLTGFREAGLYLDRGNIARWVFYTTGITGDLTSAWLQAKPNTKYAQSIVIARSSRYNNPLIDYSFLSKYDNVFFVGVESEYLSMKEMIPAIKWAQVNNFLEMAEILTGCKVFLGNQSFPYSIAEGLKIPRVLEVFFAAPNVMPEGPNGYDYYFQEHFEYLVETLYTKA
jgi:hypothetical protein